MPSEGTWKENQMIVCLVRHHRLLPVVVVGIATLCAAGCGGGAIDAGTVPVSGMVTLDGKPIDGAAVAFIGREGARLATAQTDRAGKFTIRAALGKNVVTVAKTPSTPAPPSDEPQLMPTQGEYQKLVQAVKSDVPVKYGDPKTSGLSIDAAGPMNDVELALSTK